GDHGKIVDRRWGRDAPLERRTAPGIIGGALPVTTRAPHVVQEDQHRDGDEERADRRDEIEIAHTEIGRVGVDAAWYAQEADEVHRKERQVHAEELQPEVPLAQWLRQEP